jgi:hypothetical protein
MESRSEARADFDIAGRVRLLEQDNDTFDRALDKMNARLGKIFGVCVSVLVSLLTACLLLILNLVVAR